MASPTPVGVIFILKTTIQVVLLYLKEEKYNYNLPKGAARGAGGGCQEGHPYTVYYTEAEFLDEIQTKVLRVFLVAIHISHLYSFALRFLFLQTHAISYSFYSSVTVHWRKEENLIENYTPFPKILEIHTETSSLRTLKILPRNCTFMNSASLLNDPYLSICSTFSLLWYLKFIQNIFLNIELSLS